MQTGMRMQYLQSFSCRHDFASSDFRLDLTPDVYRDGERVLTKGSCFDPGNTTTCLGFMHAVLTVHGEGLNQSSSCEEVADRGLT